MAISYAYYFTKRVHRVEGSHSHPLQYAARQEGGCGVFFMSGWAVSAGYLSGLTARERCKNRPSNFSVLTAHGLKKVFPKNLQRAN
eukprot:scaffold116894_cov80-Cyclotella_meneghiniana.AAC.6